MKKILVPFDFSGASFNAVHHAIRIAQQTEAEIIFLWNRQLSAMEDDEPGPDEESLPNQQPTLWWQLLQNMLRALCVNEKQTHVHYLFKESLEGKSLEAVLQKNAYDLLVIGMEGTDGQTPLPWERWMLEHMKNVSTPLLIVPHQAPSQLVGTVSLVTDSMNIREKQALATLFDLTEAFRAHLQIVYTGRQRQEACAFRQAVKQLGLASRLDVIRHTYHFAPSAEQKAAEKWSQNNANWLVFFRQRPFTKLEMDGLRHQIAQSRIPLLLLPATEEVAHREVLPVITRKRAAFAGAD